MALSKDQVIQPMLEFLNSSQSSVITFTCDTRVTDAKRLSGGSKIVSIHGLEDDGGPCIHISVQGGASFFRPSSNATVRDICSSVRAWASTNCRRTKIVVAARKERFGPLSDSEGDPNLVVFIAISPCSIKINNLTGCILPGKNGNMFTVFGEWKRLDEIPPQLAVMHRIPRKKFTGSIREQIRLKMKESIEVVKCLTKPFILYTHAADVDVACLAQTE
jgi:hypothetical protein